MRLLILAPLLLCGCASLPSSVPLSPGAIADATTLDEQGALAVELAYKAAGAAIELAVDAGVIRGQNATRIDALDRRAYSAVKAVRGAYAAGNASSYSAALAAARGAVSDLLSLAR